MLQSGSVTAAVNGLLRVPEAAALLNVKPATVRAWLLQRKLPCVRLSARAIRIKRADVEKIISDGVVGARL
jgi:excisionase family DNA binding protein